MTHCFTQLFGTDLSESEDLLKLCAGCMLAFTTAQEGQGHCSLLAIPFLMFTNPCAFNYKLTQTLPGGWQGIFNGYETAVAGV